MKHFKLPKGNISGYIEGEQDDLIAEALAAGAVEMTSQEFEDYKNPKPSKQSRINALNVEYEKDLVALNNAWVSAKRVDGPNEEARLSIINAQITARGQKLQSDIQAILTEQ